MATMKLFSRECSVGLGIYAGSVTKSQFEALERPQEDEQDIVRIDINHDIANVTEQCRQAVLAIRQNRICAKEGSASDQRCE